MAHSLGVGIVGMGWMGETHSRAWRCLSERFYDSEIEPDLIVCADDVELRAETGQRRFGFRECTTEWRRVVEDDRVDIVVVATPNNLHPAAIEAAAEAGRHVFCEKPVGRTPRETLAATSAARATKVLSAVGYNYRRAPMLQYARQLIRDGRLGEITNCRCRFLVDYGSNPDGVLSWRFQREIAGWGVLGDIMSHLVDMAMHLVGPLQRVMARQRTFITERPLGVAGDGSHFSVGGGAKATVSNEDYVSAMADFKGSAVATFEVSRVTKGRDCEFSVEVDGAHGGVKWNYERMNELELRLPDGNAASDGWTTLLAGPNQPDYAQFYPGPANSMSYDDLKAIDAFRFAQSVVAGRQGEPGLEDALRVAEVLDAMQRSCDTATWAEVRTLDE